MKRLSYLVLIICAVAFTACTSSNSPKGVAEQYMKAIKAKDFKKAITYFEGMDTAEQEMLDALTEKMEGNYSENGGVKSYKILSESIDEETGVVTVEVQTIYEDDSEEVVPISLTKNENGNWKIQLKTK